MWKGLVAFLVVELAAQAYAAPARRGDWAPAFTARDTTGKLVKLADLKGKQNRSWSSGPRMGALPRMTEGDQ